MSIGIDPFLSEKFRMTAMDTSLAGHAACTRLHSENGGKWYLWDDATYLCLGTCDDLARFYENKDGDFEAEVSIEGEYQAAVLPTADAAASFILEAVRATI